MDSSGGSLFSSERRLVADLAAAMELEKEFVKVLAFLAFDVAKLVAA